MMGVVEPVASLHAQPVVVRRAVAAGDELDDVLLDVVGEEAAHAAERAHRVDLLVDLLQTRLARRHQRAGGTGLHALAAGDAGRLAHRVVEIEDRHRAVAAVGVADDVVHLNLAASAHAASALDAGVEVDRDRGMGNVRFGLFSCWKSRTSNPELLGPEGHLVLPRVALLRHVGKQELQHHLLRSERARRVGSHLHARGGIAAARRREHALALDFDHAGAAVAVGALVAAVAKMRDVDPMLLRGGDDRLVGTPDHGFAVELELDRHHCELLGGNSFHEQAFLPADLVREILHYAEGRVGGGLTEAADRRIHHCL
jgi:hypothetical protein